MNSTFSVYRRKTGSAYRKRRGERKGRGKSDRPWDVATGSKEGGEDKHWTKREKALLFFPEVWSEQRGWGENSSC